MAQHLTRSDASGGLGVEAALDEILRFLRHAAQSGSIEKYLALVDHLEHLFHRRRLVRHLAQEALVHEHTDGPAVHLGPVAYLVRSP